MKRWSGLGKVNEESKCHPKKCHYSENNIGFLFFTCENILFITFTQLSIAHVQFYIVKNAQDDPPTLIKF